MKTINLSLFATGLALVAALASCKKSESTQKITPVIPPSHPIAAGDISGFVKGTLLTGNTYNVTADLTVKKGDTLAAQPGAIIVIKNDAQININGVLQVLGSQDKPVTFDSDTKLPGSWGGFACDSAQAVTIQWAHVNNTGGPDPGGDPRKSVSVAVNINVDIEDSWFTNGQDDLLGIKAAHVTILRNTIESSGNTDGEAINLKAGVTGDVAYNVIYNQAGTGVKLETNKDVPFPQTEVKVYNNTIVSSGWRRGAAEPGRGVSVGVNAIGHIYNNIMVNNYQGIDLISDGDTKNTTYGNNLFYDTAPTFVDNLGAIVNLATNYYPSDGVGKAQTSDLISVDPMFTTFDGGFAKPNGASDPDNLRLKTGSPALGKGNPAYNADMGAYTTDGKGNKH